MSQIFYLTLVHFYLKRNKKAQDVYNEAKHSFVKKTDNFDEAFPEIENVIVEVDEYGEDAGGKSVYSKGHFGEFINCSNKICYNGGFNIGEHVRRMIVKKETEFTGEESCRGYEGSPGGKKKYRDCENTFSFRIRIKYKEAAE